MRFNLSTFIAKRWAGASSLRHSRHIVRMGVLCIGLCVCVMLVSVAILSGFKNEVSEKVFGFGSHVVIQPYLSEEETPCIVWDSSLRNTLEALPPLASARPYTLKGALVRGSAHSHGVFFKGLPPGFDTAFFAGKIRRGCLPQFARDTSFLLTDSNLAWQKLSNEVLISEVLANKLGLDTGSRLRTFFAVAGELRPRALRVCGIYRTGLEKFDETYILGHIGQVQRLNGWNALMADGVEIRLQDPQQRHAAAQQLVLALPYRYNSFVCDRLFPEIFDWLVLVDANVWVLAIIMLIVCLICLVSLLFVLIMERKAHVGILLSMGASPRLIRRIFVQQTLFILGRGLLWGNAAALLLCLLQKETGWFKLNEAVYFLDRVPVGTPWGFFLGINLLVVVAAYLLLLIVASILQRYRPHKTIKSAAV